MITNSIDATFDKFLESVLALEDKDKVRLFKKVFPRLTLNRLKYLSQLIDEEIEEAAEREDEGVKKSAKFLYKQVGNNHYVSLVNWGGEDCNEYLGPMPFLPNVKYKLTHKITGDTKTLIGYKLYRENDEIYMKVEQLTPVHQVLEFLYYERYAEFPRRPQDICIKRVFAKKDWLIEKIKDTSSQTESINNELKNESSLSKSFQNQDSNLTNQKDNTLKEIIKPVSKENLSFQASSKLPNVFTNKPRKQTALTTVLVSKNFISQIKSIMNQWINLNQLLQSKYQWILIANEDSIGIYDSNNKVLVEYNSKFKTILTKSPHILLNLLKQNFQVITQNSLGSEQQQLLAIRYLERLNEAPINDATQLLAHLFGL